MARAKRAAPPPPDMPMIIPQAAAPIKSAPTADQATMAGAQVLSEADKRQKRIQTIVDGGPAGVYQSSKLGG